MSDNIERFFHIARTEALKCYTHRQRVGCVVVRGGNIVAKAYNHHGRHAEVAALSQLWPNKRAGVTLYVARAPHNKMRLYGLAKPCEECQKFLVANRVGKVYFTGNWDVFSMEKF